MAEFLLLLHESEEDFSDYSPEEMQKIIEEYRDWTRSLMKRRQLASSNKLTDEPGKVLRSGAGGEVLVTDGPYSETKELVGGYYVIKAADYDEAVAIAREAPHLRYGGRIELRMIHELPPID